MLTAIETGKPYPGAVPAAEGAHLELKQDGLILLIQMPGCTRNEARAFKSGVRRYAYIESTGSAPVALWVFDFKKPHGPVDVNFNARIVPRDWLAGWMMPESGQIKNALNIILLDRHIVRGIRLLGLDPAAVRLFHATIEKQLAADYEQSDYDRALAGLYAYSSEELMRMGTIFSLH